MMMPRAEITGWGKYVPTKILTNDDLAKMVDTSDEWIVERTGIRNRDVASPDETTATLAIAASRADSVISGNSPVRNISRAWKFNLA